MVNMSVPYRRPDGMSLQLREEVRTRFGAREQNKGFVTGYMDAARAGQTGGHFADAHGVTHAYDIGVDIEADGTGLCPADALWLAEHLRALGAAGRHPFSRRGYLIHDMSTTTTPAPRIAGFQTGWRWQVYTGASPHSDHIHVTTGGDQQWGEAPQLDPVVYNSRQPWGVAVAPTPAPAPVGAMRPAPEMYPVTQSYRQNATSFNSSGVHGAIDYGVPVGTPLLAPEDGVVVFDGWAWDLPGGPDDWHLRWYLIKPARGDTKGGGGILTIFRNAAGSHWGLAHASESYYSVGDRVRAGQVLQASGATGIITGPHSHVNLWPATPNWANGAYGAIDPAQFITRRYAPITATSWVGSPTTGQGATTPTDKDWFDMATKDELRAVVREELTNSLRHAKVRGHGDKTDTTLEGLLAWNLYRIREEQGGIRQIVTAVASAVRPSTLVGALLGYVNPSEKAADAAAPDVYGKLTALFRRTEPAVIAPDVGGGSTAAPVTEQKEA